MQDKGRNGIWNFIKGIFFKPSWEYVSVMWFLSEWFLSHCSSSAYFFFQFISFPLSRAFCTQCWKETKGGLTCLSSFCCRRFVPSSSKVLQKNKNKIKWEKLTKKMCHSKSSANRDTIQTSFCVHKDSVQYQEKITVKEKYNVVSMILHKGVLTDTIPYCSCPSLKSAVQDMTSVFSI